MNTYESTPHFQHSHDYYQSHLNRVSRSFAFCIRVLNEPYRETLSIAYLLLRILDSIEDSNIAVAEQKIRQIEIFESFITGQVNRTRYKEWSTLITQSVSDDEKKLIIDGYRVFDDLLRMDQQRKIAITDTVSEMAFGMKKFLISGHQFNSLQQTEEYCDYVAGTVGRLILRILRINSMKMDYDKAEFDAIRFGRFLQKINILKDENEDRKQGKKFFDSRKELIKSLFRDAESAQRFISEINIGQREIRLFCIWSFVLGLETWKMDFHKIEKLSMLKLISKTENMVNAPNELFQLFNEYFSKLKEAYEV